MARADGPAGACRWSFPIGDRWDSGVVPIYVDRKPAVLRRQDDFADQRSKTLGGYRSVGALCVAQGYACRRV